MIILSTGKYEISYVQQLKTHLSYKSTKTRYNINNLRALIDDANDANVNILDFEHAEKRELIWLCER